MRPTRALRDLRTIKRLLTGAEDAARRDGDGVPGPEHLLLSALALPDGTARRAFAGAGADPDRLPEALEQAHVAALAAVGVESAAAVEVRALRAPATGAFRSTPQAQQVFADAVSLARTSGPTALRGAHVVAAVTALDRGTVARALAVLGVDRTALRAAARAELGLDG